MAYIETRKRKNGAAFVVEFRRAGRAYKLSLDKTYNIKDAKFIAAAIDSAIAAEKKGAGLDAQTRRVFENLTPDMRRRLERVGLLAVAETMTLGEAIDLFEREYLPTLGERTQENYQLVLKNFTCFIGDSARPVDAINADEAEAFAEKLRQIYAKNTVNLRIAQTKTFFRFLEKRGIVQVSPFTNLVRGQLVAGKRRYVAPEIIVNFAATLDPERRALLYLYRFAGLRKSEPYYLTYRHIDLERARLTIPTPKTARFAGHGERVAPIVAEVAEVLRVVVGDRTDDALVFSARVPEKRLRAALPEGARAFHDLRASCENDWLEARFPAHVVAAWLGHALEVQARHYAIVLDSYFEEATGKTLK